MTTQQSHNTNQASEILDNQVIHFKKGRLNKFGFEPAWNSYFDYYSSTKYLEKPILRLEDIAFHLFLRKNLNDDNPTWKMPSMRMMKRRFGYSQDKIEGIIDKLTKAHLLKKISGKRKGKRGENISNTYELSDPIQNLEEFLTVAAAGEFTHPLREKWQEFLADPVPMSGTPPTHNRYTPVPMSGTHKHTSYKQTLTTTNNVVVINKKIIKKLTDKKIQKQKAEELASKFSEDYIDAKLEYLEWKLELQAQGKARGRPIEDEAAWLIRAIEKDYKPPKAFKPKAVREKQAAEKAKQKAQREHAAVEQEKHRQEEKEKQQQQKLEYLQAEYGTGDREFSLWEEVLGDLKLTMTQATFQMWLSSSVLLALKGDQALVGVSNQAAVDWLSNRLSDPIARTLTNHLDGQQLSLKFITLDQPIDEVQDKSDIGPSDLMI